MQTETLNRLAREYEERASRAATNAQIARKCVELIKLGFEPKDFLLCEARDPTARDPYSLNFALYNYKVREVRLRPWTPLEAMGWWAKVMDKHKGAPVEIFSSTGEAFRVRKVLFSYGVDRKEHWTIESEMGGEFTAHYLAENKFTYANALMGVYELV